MAECGWFRVSTAPNSLRNEFTLVPLILWSFKVQNKLVVLCRFEFCRNNPCRLWIPTCVDSANVDARLGHQKQTSYDEITRQNAVDWICVPCHSLHDKWLKRSAYCSPVSGVPSSIQTQHIGSVTECIGWSLTRRLFCLNSGSRWFPPSGHVVGSFLYCTSTQITSSFYYPLLLPSNLL